MGAGGGEAVGWMHSGTHKSERFRSRNLSKCFICGDITDEEDDDQVPLHSNFDLRHSRPRRQGTAGTRRARSSSNDHHRRVASVPVHFLPRSCAGGVPQLPRSLPLVSVHRNRSRLPACRRYTNTEAGTRLSQLRRQVRTRGAPAAIPASGAGILPACPSRTQSCNATLIEAHHNRKEATDPPRIATHNPLRSPDLT